ncbi:murein biosynthesis integral membrane protein MurJ [Endothiovibrio diazotrophicus]
MSTRLLKSTAVVSAMTLVSRILGFVRDMVVARMFGAGIGTDAFFVAFKIPNLLRRLFAEGAFSQAFVPVLSAHKTREDHAEVRALVDRVAGTLALILFAVTAVGVVAAPILVSIFAPGFIDEPEKHRLAAEMLRLTFPYLLFISLTAFAGAILNSYSRFAVPALTPVLLNLALIVCALWLAPRMERPITALAWGVFIAGVVQLAVQLPFLARLGLLPRPRWGWHDSGVRKILKLMGPAIFGSSVAQINLLFDTLIASLLATGSVSWLYYSDRLMEFPLGMFGVALGTVILPALSRRHAAADPAAFSATLDWALRWALLIALPAALGLALLAGPMLTTLFQYDRFGVDDVMMARMSLIAYSLGLPGFILIKVLAPGFYARQDTRTPVRIGVRAMIANMGLNVLFVAAMTLGDLPGPHTGLALATAASAWLNAGWLLATLRRDGVYTPSAGWRRLFLQVLAANAVMALLLAWGSADTAQWLQWDATTRVLQLALWVAAAAALYFAALFTFGLRISLRRGSANERE